MRGIFAHNSAELQANAPEQQAHVGGLGRSADKTQHHRRTAAVQPIPDLRRDFGHERRLAASRLSVQDDGSSVVPQQRFFDVSDELCTAVERFAFFSTERCVLEDFRRHVIPQRFLLAAADSFRDHRGQRVIERRAEVVHILRMHRWGLGIDATLAPLDIVLDDFVAWQRPGKLLIPEGAQEVLGRLVHSATLAPSFVYEFGSVGVT